MGIFFLRHHPSGAYIILVGPLHRFLSPHHHITILTMTQSTLFGSSTYLFSRSNVLAQLELSRIHVHPSQSAPRSFEVDAPWNCPNLACNIACPHIFNEPSAIPQPPPGIPTLLIGRFNPADTPFPKRNIWMALPGHPLPLAEGLVVYLEDFGLVSLHQAQAEVTTHTIFNACDVTGLRVAQIASVKGRATPSSTSFGRKGITFLYNLFH